MNLARTLAAAALIAAAGTSAALADVVGWIDVSGGAVNPTSIITGQGHTAVALANLSSGSTAGLDVVWVFNSSTLSQPAALTSNLAALTSYVNAGGFLLLHERRATGMETVLPGGSGVTFTQSLSNNIQIATSGTVVTNGPGGVVTATNLDSGAFSNHGYATLASLPAGSTAIFDNGNASQIVDFTYALGNGRVYASTIPLDFFIQGGGPAAFRTIYAPNVLTYATNFVAAPEPGSVAMFGLGAVALGFLVKRRRAASTAAKS